VKKILSLLLVLTFCLSLCSCGKKDTIDGYYEISQIKHNGLDLGVSSLDAGSFVLVSKSGENTFASMKLKLGDSGSDYSFVSGHLQEVSSNNDTIKYKFWLSDMYGVILNETDYIYIEYFPKSDTVQFSSDGLEVTFSYAKKQETEESLIAKVSAQIEGNWMPIGSESVYMGYEFAAGTCTTGFYYTNTGKAAMESLMLNGPYLITPGSVVAAFSTDYIIEFLYSFEGEDLVLYKISYSEDGQDPPALTKRPS